MWFWSMFRLLIKPKRAACGVKSGKPRCVSKDNKSLFQRILVTGLLWKTWSVASASVWQEEHIGEWVLPNWKSLWFK